MSFYRDFAHTLDEYLRLPTFAVGVKLLRERSELPENVPTVSEALNHKVATCQGFGLARRNRLTLAMFKEDLICPVGVAVMGLAQRPDYVLNGATTIGRYNRTQQAASITEREMLHFELGEYAGLVTGPLDECDFQVDLALIYGNPAQVTRLVQAALYEKGGRFDVSVIPGAVCADILVPPVRTGQCSMGLPCWGDRTHGGTNDTEMAFSIPVSRFEEIASGLIESHECKNGFTIPVPMPTSYRAQYPEVYNQYVKDLGLE